MHTKKVRRKDENLKFRMIQVCVHLFALYLVCGVIKCISTYRATISKYVYICIYMTLLYIRKEIRRMIIIMLA